MKKFGKTMVIALIFTLVLAFAIIGVFIFVNRKPNPPATNLEFWIGDKIDDTSFSGYQEKYGLFGGREYYGTGYVPTQDDGGMQIDPEHCVLYTVTAYPDYSSGESAVTRIYITDPSVEFYGISLNSTFDDFERLMKKQGFEITRTGATHRTAEQGKYSVTFTRDYIQIRVDVSNLLGIQF